MTSKVIEIVVDAKGEAIVQTKGFAGSSCFDASRFIEQALGEKVTERKTAEYYQPQPNRQQLKQT